MMKHNVLAGMAFMAMAFSACNDDTFDFGKSLTPGADTLSVSKASYVVSTRTVVADSVLLRNTSCYLGRVKDPETGAYVTSEFMTQLNILESFSFPPEQDIVSRSDEGKPKADSCRIELYMEAPTNLVDTLAAMKIRVSELNAPMKEDTTYYSNFDPVKNGFIRQNGLSVDKMFSYNDLTVDESARAGSDYYNLIKVRMTQPYTKDGVTYDNYGSYVMQQYYSHPEYFRNSYQFVHNVCPGFYVSVADGEGVYTKIPNMCMRIYFQAKDENGSAANYAIIMAGTEEVLQTTKITNEQGVLADMAKEDNCTYIKAPAGLYTEVKLPVDDIYNGHENDSLLAARIAFQRINSDHPSTGMRAPSYVLMVQKDSLSTFFEKNKQADNVTSFYTGNNSTNEYVFSNISSLVRKMADAKKSGMAADPDWTDKHPDWDKVLLVPIQLKTQTSSTTTTITGMEHNVSVASTKLVGGSNNPYAPITIDIVYGKFNQ